jgi:hypothetical protein
MSWDYRVVRKYDKTTTKTFVFYEFHEVYYDESNQVASISESGVSRHP